MKLVEFKDNYGRYESITKEVPSYSQDAFFKVMDFKPNEQSNYSCYSNFDEVLMVDEANTDFDDNSITILDPNNLGESDKRLFQLKMFNEKNENIKRINNLVVNQNLLNNKTKKYRLCNFRNQLVATVAVGVPIGFGIVIAKDNGIGMGLLAGGCTALGELMLLSFFEEGYYDENLHEAKAIYNKIVNNNAYLNEALMKEMLLEANMFKEQTDFSLINQLNKKRNKLLVNKDDFSKQADFFIRTRKK